MALIYVETIIGKFSYKSLHECQLKLLKLTLLIRGLIQIRELKSERNINLQKKRLDNKNKRAAHELKL